MPPSYSLLTTGTDSSRPCLAKATSAMRRSVRDCDLGSEGTTTLLPVGGVVARCRWMTGEISLPLVRERPVEGGVLVKERPESGWMEGSQVQQNTLEPLRHGQLNK